MKFLRRYVIEIEGEASPTPCGWGDASHETKWLEENTGEFAAAVERYYQTQIKGRTVTVTAVPVPAPPPTPVKGMQDHYI